MNICIYFHEFIVYTIVGVKVYTYLCSVFNPFNCFIMYVKVSYKLAGRNVVEEFEGCPDWYSLTRAIEKCQVSNVRVDMALSKEDLS